MKSTNALLLVLLALMVGMVVVAFRGPGLIDRIQTRVSALDDRIDGRLAELEQRVGGTDNVIGAAADKVIERLEGRISGIAKSVSEQLDNPIADDAWSNGLTVADFPETAADVFQAMDGGIQLSEDEIKGRNTWILWTGGNQVFWDRMARESYGLVDLLKNLDTRNRATRFKDTGLVNEPGFRQATAPNEFGLWLDERVEPGIDAQLNPAVDGISSGVVGLRLFPNPDFDARAKAHWDPEKYYNDLSYSTDPNLIRPLRVGMSCGFCHVAPHPLFPPDDPEAPKWENLASVIGNQYLHEVRALTINLTPDNFLWHLGETQPRGTSDTSRVATDHNNNPNMINGIFNLGARLQMVRPETIAGGGLMLAPFGQRRPVPHVLKDGADSVGVAGATVRVYVNIGLYSQHWLTRHNALIGVRSQEPFDVATAQKYSIFWRVTEGRAANVARFFLRIKPMPLKDAPGGAAFIDSEKASLGKAIFIDKCARCHSSRPAGMAPNSPEAREWFRNDFDRANFPEDNFLSDDERYPITLIGTNAGRALGTNAARGHVWDNFSSETYKNQPSVGVIETYNPADPDTPFRFTMPAGGPGYYRTPSLIALWSSAPFLHNNALGIYTGDPSVAGRIKAFDDAAEKLLWPEKRLGTQSIWRTKNPCYIKIPERAIPLPQGIRDILVEDGYFNIGPIPAGTPVNLLANINPDSSAIDLVVLAERMKLALLEIKLKDLEGDDARALLNERLVPDLLKVSKNPDLIEDRGHTFGSELTDAEKRSLIEFLKTL